MSENPVPAPAKAVNDRCCDVLAKALAAAKKGDFIAAAVIAIGQDGKPYIMFGGRGEGTMAAYFGAAMLQEQLLAQSAAPSTILRPGQLAS